MASTTVKSPRAQAIINGEEYYLESASIISAVNTFPVVEIVGHRDVSEASRKATHVSSQSIIDAMASAQRALFSFREGPDSIVRMKVNDKSLTVRGFSRTPAYRFDAWVVSNALGIGNTASVLDGLNFSCYQPAEAQMRGIPMDNDSSHLGERIAAVAEAIMKYGLTASIQNEPNPRIKASKQAIDKSNKKIFPRLKKLLSASEMGWKEIMSAPGYDDMARIDSLNKRIAVILLSSECGFFNTLLALGEEFQCMYVPDVTGETDGKMVNRLELLTGDAEELVVDETSLALQAGGAYLGGIPQVSTVVIDTPQMDMLRGQASSANSLYTQWPEEAVVGGRFQREPGPVWLCSQVSEKEWYTAAQLPLTDRKISAKKIKKAMEKAKQLSKKKTEANLNIMQTWAKSAYVWNSLGVCGASITEPLDFDAKVGKLYKVKSRSGTSLFTGLLAAVRHDIQINSGNGNASTSLSFSHVEAGDFELPDKN